MKGLAVTVIIMLLLVACSSAPKKSQQQIESSSRAYVKLGLGYFRQHNRVQAIENLEKAIEIHPGSAEAHNYLAVVYQEYGRPKLAEQHYKQAVDLEPGNGKVRNNYGILLYSQKKYQEAEQQFLKAVDDVKYETPEIAMEHAALSALGQSDRKKAENYFRRALKMEPKLSRSLLEMAKLSMGDKKYLNVRAWIQRYEEVAKHTPQSLWLAIQAEKKLEDKTAVTRFGIYLKNNFPDSREAKLLAESDSGS